jgi:DNA polymerase-3 subunit epsilon
VEDARALVGLFEVLAREVEGMESPRYVMRDVFVEDLVASVAQRLEGQGIRLTMIGEPLWVKADVQALLFLLEFFAREIHRHSNAAALEVETLLGDRRAYFNYCWRGPVVSQAEILKWTSSPAASVGSRTVAEALEHLGSEVWSQPHEAPGFATLRFPVPSSSQWAAPAPALPSRPVYVDHPAPAEIELASGWEQLPLERVHFVVFDTETTGLAPLQGDEIVSLAGVRIVNRAIVVGETFDRLVDPGRPIPLSSVRFHGITDEKVRGRPRIEETLRAFREFVGDAVLVGHNGAFDLQFIRLKEPRAAVRFRGPVLDTLALSRFLHPHTPAHSLDAVAQRVGVVARDRHSALGDALITAQVLLKFIYLLQERGVTTLGQAFAASVR